MNSRNSTSQVSLSSLTPNTSFTTLTSLTTSTSQKTTNPEPFYQLLCTTKSHSWGKIGNDSLAAVLCAGGSGFNEDDEPGSLFEIEDDMPYSEMGLAASAALPAYVASTSETLRSVIGRFPSILLGNETLGRYNNIAKFPILPRVLSINRARTLQVHPSEEFLKRAHRMDARRFPDGGHKPVIAMALTKLEAFVGFKSLVELKTLFQMEPLKDFMPTAGETDRMTKSHLRGIVETLLTYSHEQCQKGYKAIMDLPKEECTAEMQRLASILAEQYSEQNPNLLVGLLTMNYIVLQTGECLYVPADGVYAYLSGDIIECKARAEDVKTLSPRDDPDTFCSMLTFTPRPVKEYILQHKPYERSKEGRTKVFEPPLREFRLCETRLDKGAEEVLGQSEAGIVVVTKGGGRVETDNAGKSFEMKVGSVYFVAQGTELRIEAGSNGLVMYIAYVGGSMDNNPLDLAGTGGIFASI